MRVLLLTIGTRGDVEPFCVLATQLLQRDHCVDFFLESNWMFLTDSLVRKFDRRAGLLKVHGLPFTNAAFFPLRKKRENTSTNGRSPALENLVAIQRDHIFPCFSWVHSIAVASAAQVIVANSFATFFVCRMAQCLHIPAVFLHLQPLIPNQIFPSYRLELQEFVDAIQNYYSVREEDSKGSVPHNPEYMFQVNPDLYKALLEDSVNMTCTECTTPCFAWEQMEKEILAGHHQQFALVNAYSNHLIPPISGTPGVGPNVHDVGPLADSYIPSDFVVPRDLTNFLQSTGRDKPICIGFGSMRLPSKMIDNVVWQAVTALLENTNHRIILVGDALEPPDSKPAIVSAIINSRVLHLSSVPYPFLLPQCSMMVCHGGAGVLQSCLRAGVPSLVCPVVGDQFALAALVDGLGFGRNSGSFAQLTARHLIDEIRCLQRSDHIQEKCRRVSEKIRLAEPRASKLVDLVEQIVEGGIR